MQENGFDYSEACHLWTQHGGHLPGTMPQKMFEYLAETVRSEWRTLEYGSGLSTLLFDRLGSEHLALEHEQRWHDKISKLVECEVRMAPMNRTPWYTWAPPAEPFDLVLIDGPQGKIGRRGALTEILKVAGPQTIALLDDVHRGAEKRLCGAICSLLEREAEIVEEPLRCSKGNRAFAILRP